MDTTNATTVEKAVELRERIMVEFKEILPLIRIDTAESSANVMKKAKFLFKAIGRFMDDEKENLFPSDLGALNILQSEIVKFITGFEKKGEIERLKEAKSMKNIAAAALEIH